MISSYGGIGGWAAASPLNFVHAMVSEQRVKPQKVLKRPWVRTIIFSSLNVSDGNYFLCILKLPLSVVDFQ